MIPDPSPLGVIFPAGALAICILIMCVILITERPRGRR
jgi:hypothetical protein